MRDLEAGRVAKRHQGVGREDPNKVHLFDTGAISTSALFGTLFSLRSFVSGFLINQLGQIIKKAFYVIYHNHDINYKQNVQFVNVKSAKILR